jgi:hypothetical protein
MNDRKPDVLPVEGAALMGLHVFKIDSDWFVAKDSTGAKEEWENFYGTGWDSDSDDPEREPDTTMLTIEERGDDDEDLTKTHVEWAEFNGLGWLASEV